MTENIDINETAELSKKKKKKWEENDEDSIESFKIVLIGANGFIGNGILMHFLFLELDRHNALQARYGLKSSPSTNTITHLRCAVRDTTTFTHTLKKLESAIHRAEGEGRIRLDWVSCNITDVTSVRTAIAGATVVINATGLYKWYHPNTQNYFDVNQIGAKNILNACLHDEDNDSNNPKNDNSVQKLVHISTVLAYGSTVAARKEFTEKDSSIIGTKREEFASLYAYTKYLGDQTIRDYYAENPNKTQLKTNILLLACVLGAGDDKNLADGRPGAVQRDFILGKIPLLVAPDTEYIYVDVLDVARAVEKSMLLDEDNYNIQQKQQGIKNIKDEQKSDNRSGNNTESDSSKIRSLGPLEEFLIGNWQQRMTTKEYFQKMDTHNLSIGKVEFGQKQLDEIIKNDDGNEKSIEKSTSTGKELENRIALDRLCKELENIEQNDLSKQQQVRRMIDSMLPMLLPENAPSCPNYSLPLSIGFFTAKLATRFSRLWGSSTSPIPEDILRQAWRGSVLFRCEKADKILGFINQNNEEHAAADTTANNYTCYVDLDESVRQGIITARRSIVQQAEDLLKKRGILLTQLSKNN